MQPSRFARPWDSPGKNTGGFLEWVAISFSNAWNWKVKVKSFSPVRLLETPWTAAHQAPPSMGFSRQEVMGPEVIILVFWMLSFKPAFSLPHFTVIKRLLSSSSLSAIRVVSSAYLRLLSWFQLMLHQHSLMNSAQTLNKQDDSRQPRGTLFLIWNWTLPPPPPVALRGKWLPLEGGPSSSGKVQVIRKWGLPPALTCAAGPHKGRCPSSSQAFRCPQCPWHSACILQTPSSQVTCPKRLIKRESEKNSFLSF